MSDKWCTTCGLLTTACRCSQLDRCGECNGLIVEGFCDCDDVREDNEDEDDEEDDFCCDDEDEDEDDIDDCYCDCDCCLGICADEHCDTCNDVKADICDDSDCDICG